jgi:hypothetical protein
MNLGVSSYKLEQCQHCPEMRSCLHKSAPQHSLKLPAAAQAMTWSCLRSTSTASLFEGREPSGMFKQDHDKNGRK